MIGHSTAQGHGKHEKRYTSADEAFDSMTDFTPFRSLAGGMLIGLSASLLLVGTGRVAGISNILGGVALPQRGDVGWRVLFLLGLLAAGGLAALLVPESIGSSPRPLVVLAVAGLLVGIGTRLGSGCTSGHGVCGVSRLSMRSLIATVTFVIVGMATVALVRSIGVLS